MSKKIIVQAIFIFIAVSSIALLLISTHFAIGYFLILSIIALVFFKPISGLIIYIIIVFIIPQSIYPSLIKYRLNFTIAVIVLTLFFTHKLLRHERISLFDSRQQNLMFLLLLAIPASNISNMQFHAAWDGINNFLTVFLLFFIIVNFADNFKRFQLCCWVLVICTLILVINGIIQGFRGIDLVGVLPVEGNRIRYLSHFGDPNDFALLVNTFFPFLLVNIFDKRIGKLIRALLVLMAFLYSIALFLTNSRGGYLAFLIMLLYFAFTQWGRFKGAVIGLLLIVAGLVLAPNRMADLSPYGISASGRIDSWAGGLVMLKSRPVFGVGFMNFTLYTGRAAHSAFVNCMAELGLIGYFIWIALLYTCFTGIRALEKLPIQTPYMKYARVLKISLIGFLASALFLSQTYSPILYILIALITITTYNADSDLKIPRLFSAKEFITVVVIIIVSISIFKVIAEMYV